MQGEGQEEVEAFCLEMESEKVKINFLNIILYNNKWPFPHPHILYSNGGFWDKTDYKF